MSSTAQENILILHVDDDPDFRDLTKRLLELADDRFTVETAATAGDGLDQLDHEFDCIVSDYEMEGMNGIEFLSTVRADYANLPFILYTGKGSEGVASDAISAGVTDYFRKRSESEQYELLAARISTAVGQYRAERQLERQNDLFEKAQNLAQVGAWEYDIQAEELYWTDEVAKIHGFSPPYHPSLGEAFEFYHPDDRPAVRDAFERARTEGESYDLTVRLLPESGDQRWVRTRGEPQFDGDELVRIRGSFRDITDQKQRANELRRYEAIVEALDDAVYAVDENGTVEYVNERYTEMKNAEREAIIGTSIRQWVGNEEGDRIYSLVDELERGERDVAVVEYEFQTADGQAIPAEVRFTTLEFPDGQHGRVGVIRDIAERKERERELQRQNERLDEFVSVVSHDLRNPLNVAETSLELVEETSESPHLDRVAGAIDRSQALIDDLLTLARSDHGTDRIEPVALADVAELSWQTAETKAATLTVDTTQTIRADRRRLQQLFENLYRNAVEHGGDDVTVHVGEMGSGFFLADTGPGVPEAERADIFEVGYSTAAHGTGLGLRIVEQIAEAHGWEIAVTEDERGGARFEITGVDIVD
ncbi:MAG: PAS domain S-box-containing protein [Haloarculaceae archaeon]